MRVGAHLTISKGLAEAARQARSVGGDTFGFHSRNPRGGGVRQIADAEISAFLALQATDPLGPLVGHLPYVINLASERDIWDFGVRVVAEDLVRCHAFGAMGLVLHPGHAREDRAAGLARVATGVRQALAAAGEQRCQLLLEAMAGQTGELGATPAELGQILAAAGDPEGVGVCLDSCHLFAAGWDLRTAEGIGEMLAAFDRAVGLQRVLALHLNDSKFGQGSHKDRHERLGRGELGSAGMAAILTHPFLCGLPMIIETPVDDPAIYAEEIAAARAYAAGGRP